LWNRKGRQWLFALLAKTVELVAGTCGLIESRVKDIRGCLMGVPMKKGHLNWLKKLVFVFLRIIDIASLFCGS
jgi:hypothetical protein